MSFIDASRHFFQLIPASILALLRRFLTARSPFESNRTYFENAGIAQSKDQPEPSNQVAAFETYTIQQYYRVPRH